MNTPVIIKYPFWNYTKGNSNAVYACVNFGSAFSPQEIADRAICFDRDIGELLKDIQ